MVTVSENIKKYRNDSGLTQEELAEKTGISLSAINKYEAGIRTPKYEAICKMAKVFGTTPADLIGDDTIMYTYLIYYIHTDVLGQSSHKNKILELSHKISKNDIENIIHGCDEYENIAIINIMPLE